MGKSLAHETTRGTLWTSAATYGGKALIFLSTMILAQFLSTEDFGLVAIALTMIAFLEVLQDLGIGVAVIYEPDETAADTAFWLGFAISIVLFSITWVSAPWLSSAFKAPEATPLLQVLGFSFPLFALRNIHEAMLKRRLQFQKRFWPEIAQTFGKGVIAIGLAALGFGAWSLVWGQLIGSAFAALAYWLVSDWRPQFKFDIQLVNRLVSYGMGIVAINILSVALAQIDYLFIGYYLPTDDLGVYRVAFQIPDLLLMQFCVIIAQVIFPIYTRMRDNQAALTQGFLITMRYVALITVPLGIGVALVSRPFVEALLPPRWAPAIPVMPAIALYALFLSLSFNAGDIYKAQGKLRVLNILSLIRFGMLVPAIWWAVTGPQTIIAVGWAHAVVAALGGILNIVVAARMLHVSMIQVGVALKPSIVSGLIMTLAVLGMLWILAGTAPLIQLIAAIIVGITSYAGSLWITEKALVLEARQTLLGSFGRQ